MRTAVPLPLACYSPCNIPYILGAQMGIEMSLKQCGDTATCIARVTHLSRVVEQHATTTQCPCRERLLHREGVAQHELDAR